MQSKGFIQIINQERVRIPIVSQFLHKRFRNWIHVGQDDMSARAFWQLSRRSQLLLSFHPWRVKKLDKRKWQQDEQKYHAGEKDDDRKQAAEVTREGDVAKAQGRHDCQSPIQARDPAVLTSFKDH